MGRILFTLFTALPLIELFGLILLGNWIGALPTIGLCIFTAFFGTLLARREGIRTFLSVKEQIQTGQVPGYTMLEGLAILASGVLLVLPGLFSDLIGIILLIPWTRRLVVDQIADYLTEKLKQSAAREGTTHRIYIENHAED